MSCTSIMVGRAASHDGSVMTSHTCDCHRTGTDVRVVPRREHGAGQTRPVTRRRDDDSGPMERYFREETGTVPEVESTHAYIAPTYAAMNEFQLAIGESTLGGRKELVSDAGILDCENVIQLVLERTRTAREAIRLAGELLAEHGWCDEGEALTIADPREVWLLEIFGPGAGRVGAVWAAQRIPDDHVGVIANGSRIGALDLEDEDFFMASENVRSLAEEKGWWDPEGDRPFRFFEAYNPDGRTSFAVSRREWRVFSQLAPSLDLQPNANEFPFSVRPETPVSPADIMALFRDTYEGTDYDVCRDLKVEDAEGRSITSPLANPFMPYDMNKLLRINGGWGWMGERQLARWYCMYATVTQSRDGVPDPVGGIVWFGYANPAMTTYVPIYAGVSTVPESYRVDGRTTGFDRDVAFWASRRVATIAAHRWGEMRHDVAEVRDPLQSEFFEAQAGIDRRVQALVEEGQDPGPFLTERTHELCDRVTQAYWTLGDRLWTKYDEKW